MRRKIEDTLIAWKSRKRRKPLVIKGARQIGKTHSVLEFGRNHFEQVVHLDFMKQPRAKDLFSQGIDVQTILRNIAIDRELTLNPKTTLLFFDEIQLCENALTSLKYFCEEAPEYPVIAAGSLLGVALAREEGSYPVGKTQTVNMHPLDFEEFLWASGRNQLARAIQEHYESMEKFSHHETALDYYRQYVLVGGMPEVVQTYLEEQSLVEARLTQSTIENDYIADMTKHAGSVNSAKIHAVWRTLPAQLAKANTKFQYSVIDRNARARSYSDALEWLEAAGVVTICTQISEGVSPLKAFENAGSYKVYLKDTGLLAASFDATLQDLTGTGPKTARFRGGMAENYVIQQLSAGEMSAYYWGVATKAEVDFVIQDKDKKVVPLEVKSGRNVSSQGLNVFMRKYSPEYAIRLSTSNYGFENRIKSVPLYAAWCIAAHE